LDAFEFAMTRWGGRRGEEGTGNRGSALLALLAKRGIYDCGRREEGIRFPGGDDESQKKKKDFSYGGTMDFESLVIRPVLSGRVTMAGSRFDGS
jgi:hypothetical protein